MITENSSQINVNGFKDQLTILLHYNGDPRLIKIDNAENVANNAIEINGEVFVILSFVNSVGTLDQAVPIELKEQKTANLFYNIADFVALENSSITINLNTLVFEKSLVINEGGVYFEDINLYFMNNSKIHINSDGYFKVNPLITNRSNEVLKGNLATITTTGSYGRDNYRSSNNISVINGTGYMSLNSVWWYQKTSSRSDWDLNLNTTVYLYNVFLIGPNSAYHHINSTHCYIDGFTVMNSYSVELLQSPIYIDKFSSLNCHFGLSFYPPSSIPFVSLSNCRIEKSDITIKRNNRSNIKLINPVMHIEEVTLSGSTPISIYYETSDKLTDENGNSIEGSTITYLYQPFDCEIVSPSSITITSELIERTVEFICFSVGDKVYVSDEKHGEWLGETTTITSISGKNIEVSPPLSVDYSPESVSVSKKIEKITDSNGDIFNVEIPFGFYERDSEVFKKFGTTRKLFHIGPVVFKQIVNAYLNAHDILQTSLTDYGLCVAENENPNNVNSITEDLNEIKTLIEDIKLSPPNNLFYESIVEGV